MYQPYPRATKTAIAIVFLWRPSWTAFFKQAGTPA